MKIQIVSFHCVLKNRLGKVISSTFNRDVITGGRDQDPMLKGLIQGLQNLKKGEKRQIIVAAKDAYGFYDPQLVVTLARNSLSDLKSFEGQYKPIFLTINGERKSFRVINETAKSVTLDGNHSLAGQDLVFEIEATSVRDATPEEISENNKTESAVLLH